MTTPTLSEAAGLLDGLYGECQQDELGLRQRNALSLAANTFRALASAQSDADESYKTWLDANICHKVGSLSWLPREAYLAGHAQGYAAGLAAQEAKDTQAERDNWVVICNRWKEMYDTVIADLATAKADALELANEVRRCWTEMEASLATICEMHMLGKAHEIEMLCKDRPAAVTAAMERYAETQHG